MDTSAQPVLVVVDMQKFYCELDSQYSCYYKVQAGDYLQARLHTAVPACASLLQFFREKSWPVVYLGIASQVTERSDLHRFFHASCVEARLQGLHDMYPLESDPYAQVIDALAPQAGEAFFFKTTFSPFNGRSGFGDWLASQTRGPLVFCGLCTSQCVETTARDASDRGYSVIHVEDAQADYAEDAHLASLFASRAVCGGMIVSSATFLQQTAEVLREAALILP